MKYANIEVGTNKLLGWYDDAVHKVIPTPKIEVSKQNWNNAILNDHNKVNDDGTTELFDFRTDEEKEKAINQKIYDDKWDLVSKYLTNEIPNILDNNGNEYIVKNGEIENIRKKFFDWNDTESYNWIQYNIPTFVTHKLQLAVVMQKYNELEQLKINEIFELGEV